MSADPRRAAEVQKLYAAKVARIAEINASRTPAELATVVAYLEELAPTE